MRLPRSGMEESSLGLNHKTVMKSGKKVPDGHNNIQRDTLAAVDRSCFQRLRSEWRMPRSTQTFFSSEPWLRLYVVRRAPRHGKYLVSRSFLTNYQDVLFSPASILFAKSSSYYLLPLLSPLKALQRRRRKNIESIDSQVHIPSGSNCVNAPLSSLLLFLLSEWNR